MATGRYFTQTDFRQFNLNLPWAERTSAGLQTTGVIQLNSMDYGAVYRVNYDLPGPSTGFLGLYGVDLVRNASNQLTGGLVLALVDESINGTVRTTQSRVEGVALNAFLVHNAMRTVGTTDDQVVLQRMFKSEDRITLSPFDDYAFGYLGSDTLSGEGGNDTLLGQSDRDVLSGGSGNDTLIGGTSDDSLFGGSDTDVLRGNSGNDQLKGDQGSESTADFFEFHAGDGVDTILDWDDGVDRIRLYGVTASNQISIVALAGGDVHISALNYDIVVLNANVEDFQMIRGTGLFVLA